jgi:Ca2+/Na+ antiporter
VQPRAFLRDAVFLLIAVSLLLVYILLGSATVLQAGIFVLLYFLYVTWVIVGDRCSKKKAEENAEQFGGVESAFWHQEPKRSRRRLDRQPSHSGNTRSHWGGDKRAKYTFLTRPPPELSDSESSSDDDGENGSCAFGPDGRRLQELLVEDYFQLVSGVPCVTVWSFHSEYGYLLHCVCD